MIGRWRPLLCGFMSGFFFGVLVVLFRVFTIFPSAFNPALVLAMMVLVAASIITLVLGVHSTLSLKAEEKMA